MGGSIGRDFLARRRNAKRGAIEGLPAAGNLGARVVHSCLLRELRAKGRAGLVAAAPDSPSATGRRPPAQYLRTPPIFTASHAAEAAHASAPPRLFQSSDYLVRPRQPR